MSGSFYSLNSQYNSLLALIDGGGTGSNQGLESVLNVSENAGNRSMTNVDTLTVDTINYTTLNPPVPAHIGNISQVLAVGNDATNQNIINLGSVAMKSGGGGSLTFQDGTVQSTAFTGVASTPTISDVITAGSDASGQIISNILGLSTGSVATNPDKALNLFSFNAQDINLSALATPSLGSGAITVTTQALGSASNTWTFGNNNNFDLPQGSSINYPSGAGLSESVGQVLISSANADLILDSVGAGDVNILPNLVLGGSITFPDASIQTTAFTGTASTPTLSAVLTAGSDASGQSITGINNINLTNINGQAYPPEVLTPQLDEVLTAGNNAGGLSIFNLDDVDLNTINGQAYPPVTSIPNIGAVLTAGDNASGRQIINLQQITSTSGGSSNTINPTSSNINVNKFQGGSSFISNRIINEVPSITISTGDLFLNSSMTLGVGNITADVFSNFTLSSPVTPIVLTSSNNNWSFNPAGSITFPDDTVQTTAFTGTTTDNLTAVLTAGNSAGGLSITNLSSIGGATYFISDDGADTFFVNTTSGGFDFYTSGGGGFSQSTAKINQSGFELKLGNMDIGGGKLTDVQSIVSTSDDVLFTDGGNSASQTGSGITLLGSNLGSVTGNFGVAVGLGAGGLGNLGNSAVAIGANSARQGANDGAVAVGVFAGGGNASSGAMGSGSVSIGQNSGAGFSSAMSINCVAIGNGAGGFGMDTGAIAIGAGAGQGTLQTAPQGSNSICIGKNAGFGFGSSGVPANSFVVSSVRSAGSATNQLTYNTTTKEIQVAPLTSAVNLTNISQTFAQVGIPSGVPTTFPETLVLASAGTWLITGNFTINWNGSAGTSISFFTEVFLQDIAGFGIPTFEVVYSDYSNQTADGTGNPDGGGLYKRISMSKVITIPNPITLFARFFISAQLGGQISGSGSAVKLSN